MTTRRSTDGQQPRRARSLARLAALGIATATITGGCIVVEDDDPTQLTVVLFWEDGSDGVSPNDQTCFTAGVDWQSWGLRRIRADGKSELVDESKGAEPCQDFIEFGEVAAGEYRLEISGGRNERDGDEDDDALEWMGTRDNLFVDRFPEEYGCDVFLSEGPFRPPNRDRERDAGTDGGVNPGLDAGLDGGEE